MTLLLAGAIHDVIGKRNISLMLMGGWDTTAIFGHEKDLRDALYYGKFVPGQ